MARNQLRLDSAGIQAILKSAGVQTAIKGAAGRVAVNVNATAHDGPAEVKVSSYMTDRAAAAVTIAHPGGIGMEAKHGYLTRAARAAGLEVSGEGQSATDLIEYTTRAGRTRTATRAQVDNWTRGSRS